MAIRRERIAKFLFVYRSEGDTFNTMVLNNYGCSTKSGEHGLLRRRKKAGCLTPAQR